MEDEENWNTISLSSFDPTLCVRAYCSACYKLLCTYHVVWVVYYILAILVRCKGNTFSQLLKKTNFKRGELGYRKDKWDSWWGEVG